MQCIALLVCLMLQVTIDMMNSLQGDVSLASAAGLHTHGRRQFHPERLYTVYIKFTANFCQADHYSCVLLTSEHQALHTLAMTAALQTIIHFCLSGMITAPQKHCTTCCWLDLSLRKVNCAIGQPCSCICLSQACLLHLTSTSPCALAAIDAQVIDV